MNEKYRSSFLTDSVVCEFVIQTALHSFQWFLKFLFNFLISIFFQFSTSGINLLCETMVMHVRVTYTFNVFKNCISVDQLAVFTVCTGR